MLRTSMTIAMPCLPMAACGTFRSHEPPAVVESEAARQAAAAAAKAGGSPDEALAKSEAAAEPR